MNPVRLLEEMNSGIKELFRFRNKAGLKGEKKDCTGCAPHSHFQLQVDKPSLEVAHSQGIVLLNGFVECLRRKTSQGSAGICPVSAWAHTASQPGPSRPDRGNPWAPVQL